ncbi:hypothetical protein N7510_009970 [Penicillium lagena]|uniref:uncharacterized protein n=1 Tax=Penicillium lagena TaxID=94218 RepID=UPI002540F437|nr:uncharacterized protein N7510_009970 [Penicillium lagena]KAJ5604816.1 hypothetical protein N7510_009970 [Penicillium lagena]
MPQAVISYFVAAHTGEIPYVFGIWHFDFPTKNLTCTRTLEEWNLSKQMTILWIAMAENANLSIDAIHWPQLQATSTGIETPEMIFGSSNTPGH